MVLHCIVTSGSGHWWLVLLSLSGLEAQWPWVDGPDILADVYECGDMTHHLLFSKGVTCV